MAVASPHAPLTNPAQKAAHVRYATLTQDGFSPTGSSRRRRWSFGISFKCSSFCSIFCTKAMTLLRRLAPERWACAAGMTAVVEGVLERMWRLGLRGEELGEGFCADADAAAAVVKDGAGRLMQASLLRWLRAVWNEAVEVCEGAGEEWRAMGSCEGARWVWWTCGGYNFRPGAGRGAREVILGSGNEGCGCAGGIKEGSMRSAFAAREEMTESWRALCEGSEGTGLHPTLDSLICSALYLRRRDVSDAGVGNCGGSGGLGSFLFIPFR